MPVNNIDSWAPTQLYRSGIWGLGPGIWMFKANASPAWGLGLAPSRPRTLAPGGQFRRWSRGAPPGAARSRFRLMRGGGCQRGGAGREPEVGRGLRPSRRRRHPRTAHGAVADLRVFLADIMLQFLVSGAAEERAGSPGRGSVGSHCPPRLLVAWRGGLRGFVSASPKSFGRHFSASLQVPKTFEGSERAFSKLFCDVPACFVYSSS